MAQWKTRSLSAIAALTLAVGLALAAPRPAQAQMMRTVAQDALWGGALGALVGTAQVLMYEKNQDKELHRIVTGFAIGVMAGMVFGMFDAAGAFASYDARTGQVAFGVPRLEFSLAPGDRRVQTRLFEAKF